LIIVLSVIVAVVSISNTLSSYLLDLSLGATS